MFREDFHCIVEIKNNDSYTKDDAFKTLQIINTWNSNIDTKTSFCLAFCAVMIGILLQNQRKLAVVYQWLKFEFNTYTQINEHLFGVMIAVFLVTLFYACFIMSLYYFFSTIIATIENPNKIKSNFFFGFIATLDLEAYKNTMLQINEKMIVYDLIEQIHTNSLICIKKARYYNKGMLWLQRTMYVCVVCLIFGLL